MHGCMTPSRLTLLATRAPVLVVLAATATGAAFLAAMFVDSSGQGYGLPSVFYLGVVLAALAGGRHAALIAAPLVTGLYVVALASHGMTGIELATTASVRLGVSLVIGVLIGSSVAHGRQLASDAHQQSTIDPLTGLGNRRALETAWEHRSGPVGVLMIDMDGLKALNDRDGHAAGDHALRALAAAISLGVRPTDTVTRIGGDEFAVIANLATPDELQTMADRIEHNAQRAGTRASIGIALSPHDGNDLNALLNTADQRMYQLKANRHRNSPVAPARHVDLEAS